MSKEKGSLSIHSENIFPIIKKWLYSDHDIFVRELISNASDAITKLKKLDTMGDVTLGEDENFNIQVLIDEKNKTLTFIDNGIGMTDEEIKKYINQIAFSGAEDFLNQYKDKSDADQIIGHFGLGFYSAFMVAAQVEINTLSYKEGAMPVKWLCDGGIEFEMEDGTKTTRGTEIILHIGDDGMEFLNNYRMNSTIEKYCSFMPYDIFLTDVNKEVEAKKDDDGNEIIEEPKALNDTAPLYLKNANDCTDEEYKEFYRKTFNDFKEPLFWIHLNMDYPFNLKGILYFPRLKNEYETNEGQIKLYNSQVFVANNIKEVIPEFLLLLKGVIDCPDLPLNVSRSFLQNDGFVKKISDYITKKVGDKLNSLYKTDQESYEKFWGDINPFIKYGCLKDDKFYDKMKDIIIYKNLSDTYMTLPDYLEANHDKHENQVFYATDTVQQSQYINLFKEHEMDAVILDSTIDQAFISHMEGKEKDVKFARIDADLTEHLIDSDDSSDEDKKVLLEKLENIFRTSLSKDDLKVQVETLKTDDVSGMIILPEESRRMQEMTKMYGFMNMGMDFNKTEETLLLNKKHSLVNYIIDNHDNDEKTELVSLICEQLYDLAMLSHKPLEPARMTKFVKRSNEILKQLI
jgi:molecular chaperone HtpG